MRIRSLIDELHRRRVWQVLGGYAVVAWLLLWLAEKLEGLIGLPLWFGPATAVVVLLGFPVMLATALAQGGRKEPDPWGSRLWDSANGGDESLSSWKSLEGHPVRDALRQVFTWRNAFAGGVLMAVLLVVVTAGYTGLRSGGIGAFGSLAAKGVFDSNDRLILSDFEDRTSEGALGETVTALFRIDLAQSGLVRLLGRTELSQALVRMARQPGDPLSREIALELAQREGVKAVLEGEVLPLGPGAVVSVRLVSASSGETLVAGRESARTVDAVPDAVDRLSAQLRERIGESLRSIQGDPPLEEVTTKSLDALRKYAQAERAMDQGDLASAESLVKEAIAIDSTFFMAYRKLGVILSNDARNEEEAREAFTKAYEGRDRLTERERLLAEAAYYTYVSRDLDAAVHAYEGVLAIDPRDAIAANNLAVLFVEMGQPEKAADIYIRAIEDGQASAVGYANAVETLFEIGRADSASAILSAFRTAFPDRPQPLQQSAGLASAQFDYEAAEGFVRELMAAHKGSPRWEMWGEAELAGYAMVRGKLNEGAERSLRAYALQDQAGTRFSREPRALFEVAVMATLQLDFLEDREGAVHTLDQAPSGPGPEGVGPGNLGHLELAGLYARAGRPDRARERLRAFRAEVPSEIQGKEGTRSAVRSVEAAIALADGNPAEAVRLFREARSLVPECDLCGLPELGEAFEAAAMPDSAVAAYEGYLEAKDLFRSQTDGPKLHRILLGLGRSYEALGQVEPAAHHYRWLLDLWSDADPGMQPRVEQLDRKLATLGNGNP